MAFPFARTLDRLLTRPASPARVRSFDGATGSRRGKGMGMFGRTGTETAAAGPMLRSRARYLAANHPWIANAVANWVGALIGSGPMPNPVHLDKDVRAALSALWAMLCERADADGRTDLNGLMADVARALVVDGESFVLCIETPEGPTYRHLPAELVDESYTRDLAGGGYAVSGVEFGASGRRVAYHRRRQSRGRCSGPTPPSRQWHPKRRCNGRHPRGWLAALSDPGRGPRAGRARPRSAGPRCG